MTAASPEYVANALIAPVAPVIMALAEHVLKQHSGVLAVLVYGSALRDAEPESTLIDFYVLTEGLEGVSPSRISQFGCSLVPPNVYFQETTFDGKVYRCKYAALPLTLLAGKVSSHEPNPYFWVRFAQPMRLVWAANDGARRAVTDVIGTSIETAFAHADALAPQMDNTAKWTALFENTYRTELRPEAANRARDIVERQKDYFAAVSGLASPVKISEQAWFVRRCVGKLLSVLRLLKAAFTFQAGADYAAWKIKRHSGVDIKVTDWHRRHPVLASILLLPALLRRGALK
jgi:hypothetical protein